MVNRTFTDPLIVSGFPDVWQDFHANQCVIADEDRLDCHEATQDLVIHAMGLHWADDAVGQIIQCRRALKPDGLFLAAFLGGQTLNELRACMAQAETEVCGGLSPRIAPMIDVRDAGALLQRGGFALPVADVLPLRTSYADAYALMRDIRAMGEGNALIDRHKAPVSRMLFERTSELYAQNFSEDGRIIATFEIVVLTGWAPDESQPKPLRPGSAQSRLSDALGAQETKLDD